MKLTETLYKRLANEAMEAAQISMERPKEGDKAWRKYKFDVYNLMAEGYEVPTDSVHSPANLIGHTKTKKDAPNGTSKIKKQSTI
ncbi:hypothetical protein [Limosilactobacillus balticus]|uniref:hypothetical protein n=1 Tax=Limosilactobacillus balticus TaxID=2759747 RepID=UPI001E2902E0|nr:hypothetical protein [Limosilactobacillus balticus]MCD7132973.1 hypothetical protein [Limosilactobacillus balticus]